MAKRANSSFGARDFVLLDAPGFAVARGGFRHAPPLRTIGAVDERHGLEQPLPVFRRDALEYGTISRDRLEERNRVAQARHCFFCRHHL
jgi:hypothetical protein